SLGWKAPYFVDADHINRNTVADFLEFSDFFTVDVAGSIGKKPDGQDVAGFFKFCERYTKPFLIPGFSEKLSVSKNVVEEIMGQFLAPVLEAETIYRMIGDKCPKDYALELSMDETIRAQTPLQLFFILAAVAWCGIPLDTIAPKFTGRLNKGVEYIGDLEQFAREFEEDILVIRFAVNEFGLNPDLKLSVHSGSDKFSLYPIIRKLTKKYDAGVHVKTAGTTWLEELIGLASADGDGLKIAKEVYSLAFSRREELMKPYAEVLEIDEKMLPLQSEVQEWTSRQYVAALRHDDSEKSYNPHFRQLLHVGYKIAAEMDKSYHAALVKFDDFIAPNVTGNLFDRHIQALFIE
ncbi:MAG: tagaturonate epimerase family protein, partial [Candidatus Marinimicrobia bacterium]|nr:tagaturonate epimerase family protein [Candidatus Neomarinimicrobiota bacterium]